MKTKREMYNYLIIGYSPVACAVRKNKTHQMKELHFKIWLSLKSISEKKINFRPKNWRKGVGLGFGVGTYQHFLDERYIYQSQIVQDLQNSSRYFLKIRWKYIRALKMVSKIIQGQTVLEALAYARARAHTHTQVSHRRITICIQSRI